MPWEFPALPPAAGPGTWAGSLTSQEPTTVGGSPDIPLVGLQTTGSTIISAGSLLQIGAAVTAPSSTSPLPLLGAPWPAPAAAAGPTRSTPTPPVLTPIQVVSADQPAITSTLAASIAAASGPARGQASLGVLSFNVLAPLWAAPKWYPSDLKPAVLDRSTRLQTTSNLLRSLSSQLDVICLQEVNAPELRGYLDALGPDFRGEMAQNDRQWWSNWLVPEIPWEPNGTAVIVRRSRFQQEAFQDVDLTNGNHAAVFEGIDNITGRRIRAQSIHLDSDRISNHKIELSTLFRRYPASSGVTDILAGDFNEDTEIGTAAGLLSRAGYSNVLSSLVNDEPTHPWTSSYNNNQRWGRIDHITTRNAVAVSGDVLDFGVGSISDQTRRIEANFMNTGSDHFPVIATIL